MSSSFRSSSKWSVRARRAQGDSRKSAAVRAVRRAWVPKPAEIKNPALIRTLAEMQRAGAAFLIADLKLALTMLDTANFLSASKRVRGYQNARNAFDAALRYQSRLKLTIKERAAIESLGAEVKARLDKEGY